MHSLCQRRHTPNLALEHLDGFELGGGVVGGPQHLQRNGHRAYRASQVVLEALGAKGLPGLARAVVRKHPGGRPLGTRLVPACKTEPQQKSAAGGKQHGGARRKLAGVSP
jgi:hypothetical protein